MLKFFRNIRRRLLDSGSLRKYLVYASGEILLVVIGILIALQINNWNESRKDSIEEEKFLQALKVDFDETIRRLNSTIGLQKNVVNYGKKLIKVIDEKKFEENKDSIASFLIQGAHAFWRAEPVTGTYDALIGAGKTDKLQNQELRRLLAEFSAEIDMGFEDHELSMNYLTLLVDKSSKSILPLWTDYMQNYAQINLHKDLDSQNKAIITLLNDESFAGILLWKNMLDISRLERQQMLLDYANEINKVIDSELSKK